MQTQTAMECPKCHKQAVTFMEWTVGWKAFSHICRHCGKPLQANRVTVFWFTVIFSVMVLSCLGFLTFDSIYSESLILLPCLLAMGFFLSLIAWRRGGYVSREQ